MSKRTYRSQALLGFGLLAAPWLGCSQVLGIEDAHVDATLSPSRGGSGGKGGSSQAGSEASGALAGQGAAPPETNEAGAPSGGAGTEASGGTAGTGNAGTGGSAVGPGGAPTTEPQGNACEEYCDTVTTNCKGKYEQYRNFAQCNEVCKRLPPGTKGDVDGNSVACRARQAGLAESEPFVYCKSSGPLGAGKCGSNCVSYCSLMQTACTPQNTAPNLEPSYFANSQDCLTACGAIMSSDEDPVQYSSSATAVPSSFVGNSVYCRAYHVAAGLEQDTPTEHCPHAMGGDPCVTQ